MEVAAGDTKTGSSLPPNYVSLFELRERWLHKKAMEQRAVEEKKVGDFVERKIIIDGRYKKKIYKELKQKPTGSGRRPGPESEKRASMAVPVTEKRADAKPGREEPKRGVGIDSSAVDGRAMEKKGSFNRFDEVAERFEKLSTSVGNERGRHGSRWMGRKSGCGRGAGSFGRRSYRSEAPPPPTHRGFVWVKKGEGRSGDDGQQEDDHSRRCD